LITLPAQTTSQKVAAKRYLLKKEMDEKVIPALKHATNRHVAINKWSEEKAKFNFRRVSGDLWREKVMSIIVISPNCSYLCTYRYQCGCSPRSVFVIYRP